MQNTVSFQNENGIVHIVFYCTQLISQTQQYGHSPKVHSPTQNK